MHQGKLARYWEHQSTRPTVVSGGGYFDASEEGKESPVKANNVLKSDKCRTGAQFDSEKLQHKRLINYKLRSNKTTS